MELVTPGIGLIFWMTLSFAIVLFILAKYAWKPIMNMLHEREQFIENALSSADKAKQEMANLQSNNEQLLKEAKEERDALLRDARKVRENLIEEAKGKAQLEANKIVEQAKENIQFEKMNAITDLKNQLASLSVDIAERILRDELSNVEKQKEVINNLLKDIKFN
ncbi:MAG: F0F1 ATP synthase subunit B [Bacteroidetes bacterium]|nr:F0F1 ATP synthase subunit B [Bacteroidota bacterium]